MARPPLEVADIVRAHAGTLLKAHGAALSSAKRRVLRDIGLCRTAALGGHVLRCDQCGHEEEVSYNSCRNRHCPKCQAAARAAWLEARQADLLPVRYFHVVFTVPPVIAEIALQNKRVMYGILMRASAETLLEIAVDPAHLGAKIGFLSVLHTWGQTLMHHPHVHCVVTGGGISSQRDRWVSCRPNFFLPVRVLGRLFRGKFLAMTKRAFTQGKLTFQGKLAGLENHAAFAQRLSSCYTCDWVVYAKKPFGGPSQVLKYLARYTHRVAISNRRLVSLEHGRVRFRWKDYARGNQHRFMELDAVEFLRRFLLHVLPRGFVRIRHYGLLANATRNELLELSRRLLECPETETDDRTQLTPQPDPTSADAARRCPACETGRLTLCILPRPSLSVLTCRGPPRLRQP